ncbi:hypothetical protein F0P96_15395 [Hymenobacter busanensis]|uniref:Uncharacterized protein n=1 Tax=Hymenobacter busanensis TaxID=2607656 RepID=A0A7L5A101_9BACT|nr:hypothetical protein [Hymenobacter busanensis]KAA9331615.1 hypothetical protein F0P96_15395 [Hymenobacter busanensis]QHJ08766.1 hypothetical protein GUY19_16330 [Hymenobacter busanensis]
MTELDALYQKAIDEQALLIMDRGSAAIKALPDYGDFTVLIKGQEVRGYWMRNVLHEKKHVIFELSRSLWLGFYRKYLSGVGIHADGSTFLLSDEEVGDYD